MSDPTIEFGYGHPSVTCSRASTALQPAENEQHFTAVAANTLRYQPMLSVGAIDTPVTTAARIFSVDPGGDGRPGGFLCAVSHGAARMHRLQKTQDGTAPDLEVDCALTPPMSYLIQAHPGTGVIGAHVIPGDPDVLLIWLMRTNVPEYDSPWLGSSSSAHGPDLTYVYRAVWDGDEWIWDLGPVHTSRLGSIWCQLPDVVGTHVCYGDYPIGAQYSRGVYYSSDAGVTWDTIYLRTETLKVNSHVHGVSIDPDSLETGTPVIWVSFGDAMGSQIVRLSQPDGWEPGDGAWTPIVMETPGVHTVITSGITITRANGTSDGTVNATAHGTLAATSVMHIYWSGGQRLNCEIKSTAANTIVVDYLTGTGDALPIGTTQPLTQINIWKWTNGHQSSKGCVYGGRYYAGREGDGTTPIVSWLFSIAGTTPYAGYRYQLGLPTYRRAAYGPFDYTYNRGASCGHVAHANGKFWACANLYSSPYSSYLSYAGTMSAGSTGATTGTITMTPAHLIQKDDKITFSWLITGTLHYSVATVDTVSGEGAGTLVTFKDAYAFNRTGTMSTIIRPASGAVTVSPALPEGQGLYVSQDGRAWTAVYRNYGTCGIQGFAGIFNGKIGLYGQSDVGGSLMIVMDEPDIRQVNATIVEKGVTNFLDPNSGVSPDSFENVAATVASCGYVAPTGSAIKNFGTNGSMHGDKALEFTATGAIASGDTYTIDTAFEGMSCTATLGTLNFHGAGHHQLTIVGPVPFSNYAVVNVAWGAKSGTARFNMVAGTAPPNNGGTVEMDVWTTPLDAVPGTITITPILSVATPKRHTNGRCVTALVHAKNDAANPLWWYLRLASTSTRGGSGPLTGEFNQWAHPGDTWRPLITTMTCTDPSSPPTTQPLVGRERWFLSCYRHTYFTSNAGYTCSMYVDSACIIEDTDRYRSYSLTPMPCSNTGDLGVRADEKVNVALGTLGDSWTIMVDWWPMEGCENFLADIPVLTLKGA